MSPGKAIYKTAFAIHKLLATKTTGVSAELWYRNSLYLDYFQFGKSDIDVTAFYHSNETLRSDVEKLSSALHFCPLIKEVNSYYPFSIHFANELINAYELKKDPKLADRIQSQNNTSADQFTYLIRMLFANLNSQDLSSRDVKKWKFHFETCGDNEGALLINPHSTKIDLLKIICRNQKEEVIKVLEESIHHFKSQTPLFDQFAGSSDHKTLYMLLPHQFCFSDFKPEQNSPLHAIAEAQLKWELWAMMAQPQLFAKDGHGHQHLKNIKKALKTLELKRLEDIADKFEAFNSAHP